MEPLLVYYSSTSGNTEKFVKNLGIRAIRIPTSMKVEMEAITEPFVLICPTYADDDGSKAVPKQVIKFLNNPDNRNQMIGVIASGNRNFGTMFAYAGTVISKKCNVPFLYKFELSGTSDDIANVRQGVDKLWNSLKQTNQQTQAAKSA
jgi:protein involved in ribonucleotide reduction